MADGTVSSRSARIMESVAGFLSAITDPELMGSAQDPDVCDFLAGNPQEVSSGEYVEILKRWSEPQDKDWFGYKMAHRPAQVAAARSLSSELGIEFDPDDIVLTRGAHGGLGAALGAVADPGEEVIYISPPWFFYQAMILGAGATPVRVRLRPPSFDLDLDAIAQAITPRTRAVLLNTPHNPTGRIFPAESLSSLASLLAEASQASARPLYIISDESYSRILFDGRSMVTPASFHPASLLVHTYSKTSLAPGQRLGFVAMPPRMPGREALRIAFLALGLATSNLLPDAIMQYGLEDIEALPIDLPRLQRKRDRMVAALGKMGYELHVPEATFYLLPRCPIDDDVEFARALRKRNVAVMPGAALEMPGYFRLSLTATEEMIERSLPAFAELAPGR